ncbi:MAG: PASTA domain-containing protein [Actinomycetota bacterium]
MDPRARATRSWPWPWLAAVLCLGLAIFVVLWAFLGGPDTKTVPGVIGFTQEAARAKLSDAGFSKVDTVYRSSDSPDGTVVDQKPESGANLSGGSRVGLTISTGKAEVVVPMLVGLTAVGADRLLKTVKLRPVPHLVPSDKRAGTVLAQNPAAGSRLARRAQVFFDVSKGPSLVTVPSVRGLDEARASRRIAAAGLVPQVRRVPSSQPVARVVAQEPPQGGKVKPRTKVFLNVSRGLGLVSVPAVRGLQRREAIAKLRLVGLVPVVVGVASKEPKGRVLAQDPKRGKNVQAGAEVRINVSTGPPPGATGSRPPPPPPQ